MNYTEIIITSITSALVTSGFLAAILKKPLFDYLDRKQEKAKYDIKFESEKRHNFLNSRLEVYPELSEMCYRAKVVAENCLKYGDIPAHKVTEFGELVSKLTEKLFHYKLYAPLNIWDKIHEIKHTCQNLLIWLDILSRVEHNEDEDLEKVNLNAKKISELLTKQTSELDSLLKESIKEHVKIK